MIGELNYLSYYSSGFKLDRLSYSLKASIKEKNKYYNKEEVINAELAPMITSSFFLIREVSGYGNVICKND